MKLAAFLTSNKEELLNRAIDCDNMLKYSSLNARQRDMLGFYAHMLRAVASGLLKMETDQANIDSDPDLFTEAQQDGGPK
jgi:hypothetical protein